jgi:hypothetical protein
MPSHPYINKKALKNVLIYPEDRYRKMYFEKYPHEKEDKAFRFINRNEMRYYQHPVEIFIAKQSELVKKGLSEEEAFATCAQEKEAEEAALQTERELSKQQAMLLFNTPPENLDEKRAELEEEYERAYTIAKDRQKRKRKERLEKIISLKFRVGDATKITSSEIEDMDHAEVMEFIQDHPKERHMFDAALLYGDTSDPKQLDYLDGEDEDDGTVIYSTNGPNPEMTDNVKENSKRIREFVNQGPLGPLEAASTKLELQNGGGEVREFVRNNSKPVTQAEYDMVNEDLVRMTKSLLSTMNYTPGQYDSMNNLEKSRLLHMYETLNPKVKLEDVYSDETARALERLKEKRRKN